MSNATSVGTSPAFGMSAEGFTIQHVTAVTRITIDGVHPPILGEHGGYSEAMRYRNQWFPWIDEKICEPKFDGVCEYLGVPSNRPTFVKDFHVISMNRAVDYLMQPRYVGLIVATVDTVLPAPPPIE